MNKTTTTKEAIRLTAQALFLAIHAPTDGQAKKAAKLAGKFARGLTPAQLGQAKRLALQ
jgi:hypothetical protein